MRACEASLVMSRRDAERELREQERRHAATLANITDAVITTDAPANITAMNPAAEQLTGWRAEEALGRRVCDVFSSTDERGGQPEATAEVLRTGLPSPARARLLQTRDGGLLAVEQSCAPIFDDDGALLGMVLVFRNLSERREAERAEALRLANARLDRALRGSNVGIWDFELVDGKLEGAPLREFNCWESLGYHDHAERTFADRQQLWHPEDGPRMQAEIRAAFARGDVEFVTEGRVRHADGHYVWRVSRGRIVRDERGVPIHFAGTSAESTDLRRAEAELRQSEARWRGTFESAAAGIVHLDLEGRFLDMNQRYLELTGYGREALLGRLVCELFPESDRERSVVEFQRMARGEVAEITGEARNVRADGSELWTQFTTSRLRDGQTQLDQAVSIIQDISERKRLEEALHKARAHAEQVSRAKDEFLANVSHEIRTPMNAIIGMTELVLDSRLDHQQQKALAIVKSAAGHLLSTIDDLLDFSKIEAGKLTLNPEPFALRETLDETVRALAARAHRKGLELLCDVAPDVPDALAGDVARLRQILINLVGNAIKFTAEGEVVVSVARLADGRVELRVRDTGIGISPDKQASIFLAFEQEDTSTTRRYGGTGLGLTIADRLVRLMGGRITVDSEQGRGSTFAFAVPFEFRAPAEESTCSGALRGLRVLVLDDNASQRQLLARWLREWQLEPTSVGDGTAALEALRQGVASGQPYTLVLLGERLPELNGLQLAARVREHATARIVLLSTAHADDLAHAPQVDAQLYKPLSRRELLETLRRLATDGSVPAPEYELPRRASSPPPSGPSLHILVAEDNELNAQVVEQLLVRRGHRATVARTGREALEWVQRRQFDLLLLDLHMPVLDGFQVIAALRDRERGGRRLPVVAVTARARKEDREHCLAAGMDDFLAKPILAADLYALIERVAVKRDEWVSRDVLLAACGDDDDLLTTMSNALRAQLPGELAALAEAAREGRVEELQKRAHKLAGTLAVFSSRASLLACELEEGHARDVQELRRVSEELLAELEGASVASLRGAETRAGLR
jgi:two-component system, sensor histidine kinase and response regulator